MENKSDDRGYSFKKLIVYQKSKASVVELIHYYKNVNLNWTEKYVIDQLIRAASSIGANLAEGFGRMYKLDYRRFMSISRGSCFEVEFWLDLILELRPQDKEIISRTLDTNIEVSKMLTTIMRKLEVKN